MNAVIIPTKPPQILEAVRLANEALAELEAAIEATDEDNMRMEFEAAHDDLCSAIGYMTAIPEIAYLGQHIHDCEA